MFGTTRTVAVRYKAEVGGYVAGIQKMNAATRDFEKRAVGSAKANSAEWDAVGTTMMAAGLAIGAGVAFAVKKAADFEQAMSRVGAISGASATEMTALSEAALKAGEDTVFSATEAAAAQEELAKAGVSTADILGGALRGSLDLAAAGGLDLAKSAEIAAQAMNLFNLEGSDVTHIADVLTAAANKSAAGVDDLGMALSQGGTVAAATGLTLEETAATLAMFADSGMKGSDAGTSLKTMLQRLNPTSKEAAETMERLGISAYDAQGNFVGMEALAGQLQTGMAGLTVEQRNAALATIFGSDAVRGANIVFAQGAEGMREYEAAVNDVGAAQRMASRMTDNLKGDWEELTGALETALIKTGSGGAESLRGLVQGLEGVVSAYNELPASAQSAVFNVAAFTAAALLVGGATMKATTSVLAFKASLDTLGLSAGKAGAALRVLGTGAAVAGVAFIATELREAAAAASMTSVEVDDLAASLSQLGRSGNLSGGIADLFRDTFMWDEEIVTTTEALDRFAIRANDAFGDGLMQKLARLSGNNAMTRFTQQTTQLDEALAQMVRGGNADQAKALLDALLSNVHPDNVDETRAAFTEMQAALDETGPAAAGARKAIEGVDDALDANQDGWVEATEAAEAHKEALEGVRNALESLGGGLRAERAAQREWSAALKEASEIATLSADEQGAALDNLADKALAVASAQVDMGRGSDEIAAGMQRARDQIIEAGVAAGHSRDYMEDYADAMGLIPSNVKTMVEAAGVTESTAEVLDLQDSIRRLDGKTVTVKEEGANPSKGRVMELDGAIFGLDGKTVKVQEIGATPSGERVVRFQGKIYALRGKTVGVGVRTSGESALRNLQSLINRMSGRSINVNTYMNTYRKTVDMGTYKARALGGIDEHAGGRTWQAMASGGVLSPGELSPGIYGTSSRGIWMAEDTRAPWEAYISGRSDLGPRSKAIAADVVARLGGSVTWQAMASGGVRPHYTPSYMQPAPRVTVSAPAAAPAPSIDYDALAAAVSRVQVSMWPSQRSAISDVKDAMKRWEGR